MDAIDELLRFDSPTPGNTAIAFDGELLWIGSIETNRVYAIEPHTRAVRYEFQLGGTVFGLVDVGDSLRVLLGEGEDSFRTIYRLEPESGLSTHGAIVCPDGGTGSHLAYDGERLFVGQRDLKRIVAVDDAGTVGSVAVLPYRLFGMTIVDGQFSCLGTEDPAGAGGRLLLRVDTRGILPIVTVLASLPFDAQGLAYDGHRFWTNDRDATQIVAFTARNLVH